MTGRASAAAFDPQPVVLEGEHVRLEPLAPRHASDLLEAGRDASLWRYSPGEPFTNLPDVVSWMQAALAEVAAGRQIAFAVIERGGGRAIGSTRYGDLRRADRGLEIGWTWIAPAHQRTVVNTECKLLLLTHAFDALGAMRVQFKTDARNERSQRAIERIGATREGVHRRHIVMSDGFVRDSVYYSITDLEWPRVKERLGAMCGTRGEGRPG